MNIGSGVGFFACQCETKLWTRTLILARVLTQLIVGVYMTLKYQADLNKCPDQPCPDTNQFSAGSIGVAFRFMHKPSTDPIDFIPPAYVDGIKPKDKCGRFALSFFDTLDNARKRFSRLAERIDAAARYGDYVGEIAIKPSDGLMCPPNPRSGHFDLHQDATAVFSPRVTAYFPSAVVENGGADAT